MIFREVGNKLWLQEWTLDWLPPNTIPGDALKAFRTTSHAFSVFRISDNSPPISRIVAAMACGRDGITNFDYVLLDEDIFAEAGLEYFDTKDGKLLDSLVDESHLNVTKVSAKTVVALAKIAHEKGQFERANPKRVAAYIAESVVAGYIDRSRLKDEILSEVIALTGIALR